MAYTVQNLKAELAGSELQVCFLGRAVARLDLRPLLDGEPLELGEWRFEGDRLWAPALGGRGRVWLRFEAERFSYGVDGEYGLIDRLVYFDESRVDLQSWRLFVPDELNRGWASDVTLTAGFATAADPAQQRTKGLRQSWVAAPAPVCAALQLAGGLPPECCWWGISVPGPLPVAETHLLQQSGRFSLAFDLARSANAGGRLPVVVFNVGLDGAQAALSAHVECEMGARPPKAAAVPEWWRRPSVYTQREWTALTGRRLSDQLAQIQEVVGPTPVNVVLDRRWYDHDGDWRASQAAWGSDAGLRALVDELHGMDARVILRLSPFVAAKDADVAEQTELCLKTLNSEVWRDRQGNARLDYSLRATRAYVGERLEHMLADTAGALGADGVQLEALYHTADPRYQLLSDPNWGWGDQYAQRVLKFLHASLHEIKPDACLRAPGLAAWLQPVVDVLCLGDERTDETDGWLGRARVAARTCPDAPIDPGGWIMTHAKAQEYWLLQAVIGAPSLYGLQFFGGDPIGPEDRNRLQAAWRVYRQIPQGPPTRLEISKHGETVARLFANGERGGQPAALCVGRRCLAAYNETGVYVCATRSGPVLLPLWADRRVGAAWAIDHDGQRHEATVHELGGSRPHAALDLQDAGGSVSYYHVMWC